MIVPVFPAISVSLRPSMPPQAQGPCLSMCASLVIQAIDVPTLFTSPHHAPTTCCDHGSGHPSGCAKQAGAGGRGACGAKRIRSLYLPWLTEVTPKLSTTTPPEGLASLSTVNGATMRLCRADLPASAHSLRQEAAPTACLLTEPTPRREGRPSPVSSDAVLSIMRAKEGVG